MFAKRAYLEAAREYEKVKPNQKVLQNLGDCYYNNAMMKDAARAYGKLFLETKDSISADYYFKYAQALMGIEYYRQADSIMGVLKKFPVNTPAFIASVDNIVPYEYEIQPMTRNVTNGDFGLSLFGDKVVFASYRNRERPEYKWNEKPYLDLFMGTVNSAGQLTRIEAFGDEINTKTHESSATFSPDGRVMFFNRTAKKKERIGNDKFASVRIMRAEFAGETWTNITEVPFSSPQYSTQHPFLSSDGKKLYFSSDMPGGEGSFDLWVVDVNEDGTFGTPVNLGPEINTPYREQFPFLSADGALLYFASEGHQGMGGLDVFMSRNENEQWGKPLNLGSTLNTSADDFAFVVGNDISTGYLTSNRKNGVDNLYSFKRTEATTGHLVEGIVRDKTTKELLPGTTVTLYDEAGTVVGQMVVGQNADYMFNTKPNTKYRLEAVKDFYIPHSEEFTTNAEGRLRYTIELFVENYDEAEEIITRREDGRVQIVLENIYFDLNKWDIKPEAETVLNVLYELMAKYPAMEVELGAHTDSRASNTYNLVLSNKRATAAVNYLVSKGIARKRLRSKGYGEEFPLIKCGLDRPCTEQEHSINRRCEFIIIR